MTTPKDALQPQPVDVNAMARNKMLGEMALLSELGMDPRGIPDEAKKFTDEASEQFYRQYLSQKKAESKTYFLHVQPQADVSAAVALSTKRHNIRATIANLAAEWFMIEKMSYSEFAVIARGLGYDTVLDLQGPEGADKYLDAGYEQDAIDDIYEDFPKMISEAMYGNYAFALSESTIVTRKQTDALAHLRRVTSIPFTALRNEIVAYPHTKKLNPEWTEAQKTERFDLYSYTEDMMNEFPYEENGIGLYDKAIVSQFKWDALVSRPAME